MKCPDTVRWNFRQIQKRPGGDGHSSVAARPDQTHLCQSETSHPDPGGASNPAREHNPTRVHAHAAGSANQMGPLAALLRVHVEARLREAARSVQKVGGLAFLEQAGTGPSRRHV